MSITQINRHREQAIERSEHASTPPIVAIGGVLTIKQLALVYGPVLSLDTTSRLSPKERFVPPHRQGIGPVQETLDGTHEDLLRLFDRLGERKMLLVGHSLGGLLATIFAYEHPETVAGVVSLVGAHEGVKQDTIAMRGLTWLINNPEARDMVRHDSGYMQEHRERVRTEWQHDVPLHVVSTLADRLLPPPHGFGLRPNDQPTTNSLVVPRGLGWIARGMPEGVDTIPTMCPTGHTNMPVSPPVINYIREFRDQLSQQSLPLSGLSEAV